MDSNSLRNRSNEEILLRKLERLKLMHTILTKRLEWKKTMPSNKEIDEILPGYSQVVSHQGKKKNKLKSAYKKCLTVVLSYMKDTLHDFLTVPQDASIIVDFTDTTQKEQYKPYGLLLSACKIKQTKPLKEMTQKALKRVSESHHISPSDQKVLQDYVAKAMALSRTMLTLLPPTVVFHPQYYNESLHDTNRASWNEDREKESNLKVCHYRPVLLYGNHLHVAVKGLVGNARESNTPSPSPPPPLTTTTTTTTITTTITIVPPPPPPPLSPPPSPPPPTVPPLTSTTTATVPFSHVKSELTNFFGDKNILPANNESTPPLKVPSPKEPPPNEPPPKQPPSKEPPKQPPPKQPPPKQPPSKEPPKQPSLKEPPNQSFKSKNNPRPRRYGSANNSKPKKDPAKDSPSTLYTNKSPTTHTTSDNNNRAPLVKANHTSQVKVSTDIDSNTSSSSGTLPQNDPSKSNKATKSDPKKAVSKEVISPNTAASPQLIKDLSKNRQLPPTSNLTENSLILPTPPTERLMNKYQPNTKQSDSKKRKVNLTPSSTDMTLKPHQSTGNKEQSSPKQRAQSTFDNKQASTKPPAKSRPTSSSQVRKAEETQHSKMEKSKKVSDRHKEKTTSHPPAYHTSATNEQSSYTTTMKSSYRNPAVVYDTKVPLPPETRPPHARRYAPPPIGSTSQTSLSSSSKSKIPVKKSTNKTEPQRNTPPLVNQNNKPTPSPLVIITRSKATPTPSPVTRSKARQDQFPPNDYEIQRRLAKSSSSRPGVIIYREKSSPCSSPNIPPSPPGSIEKRTTLTSLKNDTKTCVWSIVENDKITPKITQLKTFIAKNGAVKRQQIPLLPSKPNIVHSSSKGNSPGTGHKARGRQIAGLSYSSYGQYRL